MTVDEVLERGFEAGDFASSYSSDDFEHAWEMEQAEDGFAEIEALDDELQAAYRAAFVLGFFSARDEDDAEEAGMLDELKDSRYRYGNVLRELGVLG